MQDWLINKISENDARICNDLLKLFKIEGKPANEVATPGEIEIFHALVFRPATRIQILCSTQYGKSLFVAFACIIITCIQEEMVAVVAPSNEKAKIIMRYYIEHLGDDPAFATKLEKETRFSTMVEESSFFLRTRQIRQKELKRQWELEPK